MRKFLPSLITVAVWSSLYNANVNANQSSFVDNTNPRCLANVPRYTGPIITEDPKSLPVTIEANTLQGNAIDRVIYQGDVRVQQGNRALKADKLTIQTQEDNSHYMTVSGHVNYLDNFIKLQGNTVGMEIEKNDVEITDSQYHLVDRLGRGAATNISLTDDSRYVTLKNSTFTTCPVGNNSWNISGSTIIYDKEEELLEAWNTVFRIGSVPIFYSPYIQYPTGNKRRSGLLIPTFNYNSTDGVNIAVPFYWNIAPNFDATITPRIIQRRGLQLQTEGRYLTELGKGTLAFDWLEHDSLYDKNKSQITSDIGDNKSRWLFHWNHDGTIDENWFIKTDVTRVSDRQYLVDLSSQYANVTDGYLTQQYAAGYANDNWNIALSSKNFQVFRTALKDDIYRTEPQLDINYYNDNLGPFYFTTYGQIVNFTSPGKNNPQTVRLHIEPTLSYTLANSWATLNTKATLFATHYDQDIPQPALYPELEQHVTRILPRLTVDGRVIFERNNAFIDGYTQTLEPRIKYEYIPYRDQSNIKNYDSSLMQSDYSGLFRNKMYSGLDRIASANQIATGVTTRIYDNNFIERFNFSIGQIYYFNQSRTGDTVSPLDKNTDTGSLTWATDGFWLIQQDLLFRLGLQYDTRINEVALANAIFEYKPAENKLLQISYRYANQNYIDTMGLSAASPYRQDISQLGTVGSFPLNDFFSVVGAYYYDVNLKQSSDSFMGLQYNDCCWGLSILYGRKIVNWESESRRSEYDNKLSISFELRGFGRNRNTTAKMLDFGILPYRSTFE
ncbi:LPS assembly protein LptD [Utexia brackfieldae]|uniref:LPS assembly protein LptD n=1 Tax=Utexia brackfieldae TaxID=3074108 RepID=UPI00370D8224